jgi:hypothetical protein
MRIRTTVLVAKTMVCCFLWVSQPLLAQAQQPRNIDVVPQDDLTLTLKKQDAALRSAISETTNLATLGLAQQLHGIANALAAYGSSLASPRDTVSLVAQDPRYQANALSLLGLKSDADELSVSAPRIQTVFTEDKQRGDIEEL